MPIIERVICITIKYFTENKDLDNQNHFQQKHSWTKKKLLLLFKTWIIRFQAVVSVAGTPPLLWEPDTLSQNKVPLLFWRQLLEGQKEAFLHHTNFVASWALSHFPCITNTILTSLCAVLLQEPPLQLHYSMQSYYSGFPNTASSLCLITPGEAAHGTPDEPFSMVSH